MANMKNTLLYAFIYLCLIFISLYWNIGYLPLGVFLLLFLLLFSVITWSILKFIKKFKAAKYFLNLCFTCILVLITVFSISKISNRITTKRAEIIIEKLLMYKTSKGYYPKSLYELMPVYIKSIPKPTFNNSDVFFYELIDCNSDSMNSCHNFILKYYGPIELEAKYTSKTMKWQYDD